MLFLNPKDRCLIRLLVCLKMAFLGINRIDENKAAELL